MKKCIKCGRLSIRDSEKYCPNCGSRELKVDDPGIGGAGGESGQFVAASKNQRILAFSVDLAGLFVLSLLSSFPLAGMIAALAALLYQLLRDYRGASIGKVLFHLKVVSRTGAKASTLQCVLRNVIFVPPYLAFFVPALGLLAGGPIVLLIYLMELIFLLRTGQRLGDRIAGTTVTKSS